MDTYKDHIRIGEKDRLHAWRQDIQIGVTVRPLNQGNAGGQRNEGTTSRHIERVEQLGRGDSNVSNKRVQGTEADRQVPGFATWCHPRRSEGGGRPGEEEVRPVSHTVPFKGWQASQRRLCYAVYG